MRWARVSEIDPLLERLPERLERGARELRQLVEEEDAVVGEARLAGRRRHAAADQPRARDRVMRRPERPPGDQRLAAEQARDAVHSRRLQRLLERRRRQDRGHAAREHRLAAAGRPDHQHVMTAGRRHLERALERVVTADLGQVDLLLVRRLEHRPGIDVDPGWPPAAREEVGQLAHRLHADDVQALDQRGLGRIGGRDHQPLPPGPLRPVGECQRAAHGPYRAVEPELAAEGIAIQRARSTPDRWRPARRLPARGRSRAPPS